MSVFSRRIATQAQPDLRIKGTYNTPTEIPTVNIMVYPDSNVIAYQDMQPLVAPDGAPIAATGPGTWGQLYAAGRA